MPEPTVMVEIARDKETGVWFILGSTLPGLHVEGRTRDEVVENAKLATLDLLDAAGDPRDVVPFEAIARDTLERHREPA